MVRSPECSPQASTPGTTGPQLPSAQINEVNDLGLSARASCISALIADPRGTSIKPEPVDQIPLEMRAVRSKSHSENVKCDSSLLTRSFCQPVLVAYPTVTMASHPARSNESARPSPQRELCGSQIESPGGCLLENVLHLIPNLQISFLPTCNPKYFIFVSRFLRFLFCLIL